MLLKHFDPNTRQNFFREPRTPNAKLGEGIEAIKGGVGKAKEQAKKVGAKAGIIKSVSKRFGKWLVTPKGLVSGVLKSPFWATYNLGRVPFRVYEGANTYVKTKSAELIGNTREGAKKVLNRFGNITYSGARSGYYLVVAPPLEAIYGNTVRFGKRAFVDNYFTLFNTLYNAPATFVGRTIDFAKEGGRYVKNICGVRNAVSNVLTGTKCLFTGKFKEAAKNYAVAPFQPFIQTAKVPYRLGAIPYHTGAQVALGAGEVATNMGCALMTPVETTLNGYRAMAKSTEFFKDLGWETGKSKSYRERIGGMRHKIGNIFKRREGFAFV